MDLTVVEKRYMHRESENTISFETEAPAAILRYKKKTIVFNSVLKSPWCPNYLPYNGILYRKDENTSYKSNMTFFKNQESCTVTDVNNNTKTISRDEHYLKSRNERDKDNQEACKTRESLSQYHCMDCNKTFSQLRNFKYHMSVHRGTKEFSTTCPVCGKYFNDRGYLSSHMKIHKNRKEYKCSLCSKSFNQRVAYNMHFRIHTGVKPHMCEECGKTFSRKMLLKQHQRIHSGERPYPCPHCAKRFADRSNMTLHLRLHLGIKPYRCAICDKSFTKKHHLNSHLNYHTGAKPYSCPRCNLCFTQSSNMRTHLKKCSSQLNKSKI